MKRFILLTFLLIFSFVAFAQTKYFVSTHFNYRFGTEWSGWSESKINITIDSDKRHIEIFSPEVQVIDYGAFTKTRINNFTVLTTTGTDRKYQPIEIKIQVFDDATTYLVIKYSDLEYAYNIVEKYP